MENKKIILFEIVLIMLFIGIISATSINDLNDGSLTKVSNNGVKFDKEILDNFNRAIIANDSVSKNGFMKSDLNEFEWVFVTVDIKDTTNITIPYRTSPDFQLKIDERSQIMINLTNDVLSTLSDEEFILKTNSEFGGFFSGNITKEGFDKLLNDGRVRKVYAKKNFQLNLDESGPLIHADDVWSFYNGSGQTVCIIDTGVDYELSDLGGCFGPNCRVLGGYDYIHGDSDPIDDNGHGTNVAGIIISNYSSHKGIANGANVVALKACDSLGRCDDEGAIKSSLQWCLNNAGTYNISIVSMSFGALPGFFGQCNEDYADEEIENLYNAGITLVASSGNNEDPSKISYPACNDNVISVGATYDENIGSNKIYCTLSMGEVCLFTCIDKTTNADKMTCFTNRGTDLDLLAPGCEIYASGIFGCGTSQAAPHVSGAAALLLQKNSSLTPNEIKTILQNTGKQIWDPKTGLTFKRIDVGAAIGEVPFCECTDWTVGSCNQGSCDQLSREHTRTCNPSGCDSEGESKCVYSADCESGGGSVVEYTVCASGCDYTSIQTALANTDSNDRILVTDSGSYSGGLLMTSSKSGWLKCINGARIYGSGSGAGINISNRNGFYIDGCKIDYFGYGIYLVNSRHGDLKDLVVNRSVVNGLDMEDNSYDVRMSNLNVIETSGDNAVRYDGDTFSSSVVSYNKLEDSIVRKSNSAQLIWVDYGVGNEFNRNNLSESPNGEYGLFINAHNNPSASKIIGNNIFSNGIGLSLYSSQSNEVSNNTFCPSNSNNDFELNAQSTGNYGTGNRCEKPNNWDDTGKERCTYYCDSGANVELIYPEDNTIYITNNNISLVCYSEDNSQLASITLYHNASGTWQSNQTKSLSGTSNVTVFSLEGVSNGTSFVWNCLTYDNASRGGFSSSNRTVNVYIDSVSPFVNITSPLSQTYNISSINFNVTLNEEGYCNYSLDNLINISMNTEDFINYSSTNSSMTEGNHVARFYCSDSYENWNNTGIVNFEVNTIPPDNLPSTNLLSPANGSTDEDGSVIFNCSATDDNNLKNITLYGNWNGWHANETKALTGKSNSTTFTKVLSNGVYSWNCKIYDNSSQIDWGDSNWTINVSIPPDNPPATTLISPASGSVDDDGSVIFNCSATDDNNLKNITLYGNWTGNWIANETKLLTGKANSTAFTKILSNGNYRWNCLSYDNSSQGDWANSNWTINVSIIPPPANDTYKFYHKNSTGQNVAWLGSEGNIVLKGKCFSGGNCNSPGSNSIIFGNSTDNYVAFINSTGDLCVEKGDCSDKNENCNSPSGNSFIVKDSSNNNVIYIDRYGELCLTGKLYENSQP